MILANKQSKNQTNKHTSQEASLRFGIGLNVSSKCVALGNSIFPNFSFLICKREIIFAEQEPLRIDGSVLSVSY